VPGLNSPFLLTADFNDFLGFLVYKPSPPSQTGIALVSMMEVHEYWPPASYLKSESSSWNVRRHLVAMVTCLYQLLFVLVWEEDRLFCVFSLLWVLVNRYEKESVIVCFVSLMFECDKRSVCWFTDDLDLKLEKKKKFAQLQILFQWYLECGGGGSR